ncbi:hypothetical protein A3Q56_08619 [Intoshia linei]|uniref:Uncharacterized protein n=1 Tax=Intoshia linei TaxID=1819745 RepID=A0A177AQY7_9BILA|nr:hypothetical protein A3Q56_08619 [Intoshia linei]
MTCSNVQRWTSPKRLVKIYVLKAQRKGFGSMGSCSTLPHKYENTFEETKLLDKCRQSKYVKLQAGCYSMDDFICDSSLIDSYQEIEINEKWSEFENL